MGSGADARSTVIGPGGYAPALRTFSVPLSDPETCRSFKVALSSGYGVGSGRYLLRFSARSRAISDDETFFQFFDCPHVCLTKVAPRAAAGLNLAGG